MLVIVNTCKVLTILIDIQYFLYLFYYFIFRRDVSLIKWAILGTFIANFIFIDVLAVRAGDEYGNMPKLEWYNFSVVSSRIDLKAGENVIEFRGTSAALNWDYIEMTTSVTELSVEIEDDVSGEIGGW